MATMSSMRTPGRGGGILSCAARHFSPRSYSTATAKLAYLEPAKSSTSEGITFLSLNRPEAKNAISQQLLAELGEAVDRAASDSNIRVLVLRSLVPNTFCAGADLKERKHMSMDQVDKFLKDLRKALSSIESLPFPTITALDGLAMGGGMELALCTDMRVANVKADKMGLPETKLGILPGAGGTIRMTRLIGPSRTKDLIFSGRLLNATEAHKLGIIDYLAEQEDASTFSLRLAESMAVNAPIAIRAAKSAIDKSQSFSIEEALDWERSCYNRCLDTKDRLEGLRAFAEKRKPRYTGE